jgi:hypothetical protein
MTPHRTGLVFAALYSIGAAAIIANERRHPGFLPTMGIGLATLPASLAAEWIGLRLNLRSTATIGALVAANAGLVYGCVRAIARRFVAG